MDGDSARGALLGAAVGDAVGAPFEGRRTVSRGEVEDWLRADAPLTWTDDTAMTLALAESLIERGGEVDPRHLGDSFAATYEDEPWRGYGAGPPRIFAAAAKGTPYVEAAAALFGGSGSFGNGAAMRAAPAGVVADPDPGRAARLARQQAVVTHAHVLAQDGAALVAMAVVVARASDAAAGIAGCREHLETPEFRSALDRAIELADTEDPGQIGRTLGNGVAAIGSVPTALACFLGSPDDPRGVFVRAVTAGGDTDTIAAMAGAMAGARVGAAGLPGALLARVEEHDRIVDLADGLAVIGD